MSGPTRDAVIEALRGAMWRGIRMAEVQEVATACNGVIFPLAAGIFKLKPDQHQACIEGLAGLFPTAEAR